jgi:hypothetical protein
MLTGENSSDDFGGSVSTAGDVNGDGIDDVIVGAWRNDAGGVNAGRAYLYQIQGIELLSPDGGEFWAGGDTRQIKWRSIYIRVDHYIGLIYSTDGGTTFPYFVSDQITNTNSFDWSVPLINSDKVRIKSQVKDINNVVIGEDMSSADFTIDSTPPDEFSLVSPINGDWGSATPLFGWSPASDNFALSKYELWIDDQLNREEVPDSITSSCPMDSLTSGFHTWHVIAVDKAGNERQSSESWTVWVDDVPPRRFNLLSPADSAWSSEQPLLDWQPSSDGESGLKGYRIYIDDMLFQDNILANANSYQVTEGLAGISDGDHTWYVVALDSILNVTRSNQAWLLRIDSNPPDIFNLTSPLDDIWINDETPIFQWEATEDSGSGLNKYELYVDNERIIDTIGPSETSIELDSTQALEEGWHTWYVSAVDSLGNSRAASDTFTLNIDLSSPQPFSLRSPADSSFVNLPTPNFSWYSTRDYWTSVSHYSLWIDDMLSVDNIDTTVSSPSRPLSQSSHKWYAKATDVAGNSQESTERWILVVEWQPPDVFELEFPTDGATVHSGLPAFGWHGTSDSISGVVKYQLWIDGVLDKDNISADDTLVIPDNPLSNGDHIWFVRAIDRAGNRRTSTSTWQFVVDRTGNLAPSVHAVVDTSAIEDQPFRMTISASDPNSGDVLRFSDNTSLFDINRFTGEISFTPTNDDVGEHEIIIIATDGDLSDSSDFVLTVQNTNDEPLPFALLHPAHLAIMDTLNPILAWEKSQDVDLGDTVKYTVYIDTLATFATPAVYSAITDTFFVVPSGLKKSTHYFWKVEAVDRTGSITESNTFFKFTTFPNLQPPI